MTNKLFWIFCTSGSDPREYFPTEDIRPHRTKKTYTGEPTFRITSLEQLLQMAEK